MDDGKNILSSLKKLEHHYIGFSNKNSLDFDNENYIDNDDLLNIQKLIFDSENGKKIGGGGSRDALIFGENLVVILPRIFNMIGSFSYEKWKEMLIYEIHMSKLFLSWGIPSQTLIKCYIQKNNQTVETYACRSFQTYMKEDIYIYDRKNRNEWEETITWKMLPDDKDPYDLESWKEILEIYANDCLTLTQKGFIIGDDTLNFAFVGKGHPWHLNAKSNYVLRIFGFDFSTKSGKNNINDTLNRKSILNIYAFDNFKRGIENAVWLEVNRNKCILGDKQEKLFNELVNYYSYLIPNDIF